MWHKSFVLTSTERVPKTPDHAWAKHGSRTAVGGNSLESSNAVPFRTQIPRPVAASEYENRPRAEARRMPRIYPHDAGDVLETFAAADRPRAAWGTSARQERYRPCAARILRYLRCQTCRRDPHYFPDWRTGAGANS